MNHDFAKKKKTNSASSSRALPVWFWLFTGLASGLFISFLIYLSLLKIDPSTTDTAQENNNNISEQIKAQAELMREGKEPVKKPTFEFYKRLPEQTIDIPKPQAQTIETTPTKSYLLQVGSFRSHQDADTLKAQLIMQGLDVHISSIKDASGNDWHRVQVGPYSTQNKLNKAQDTLANNNISSIILEVK